MAGYNSNTPTVRGMEWLPAAVRTYTANSSKRGLAMRFEGSAVTMTSLHLYLQDVLGANPGLGAEILTGITAPTLTTTKFFPGTDTGESITGWSNSTGAAEFSLVDDEFDTTDYMMNTAALATNSQIDLGFRGNNAGTVTGRVVNVKIGGRFRLSKSTSNAKSVKVYPLLTLNGTIYPGAPKRVDSNGRWTTLTLDEFPLYPDPDIAERPWLDSEIDDVLDAADVDTFGVRLKGKVVASGFRVSGMWCEVTYTTENRKGYYYDLGKPRKGWGEVTLSGTGVLAADTFYYLHLFPVLGDLANYWRLRLPRDPRVVQVTSAAATTGEHRTIYETELSTLCGTVSASTEIVGEMLPALLDSGAIHTMSNPYAEMTELAIHTTTTANTGQQITDATAQAYAAVKLPIGWQNPARRPDRALTLQVQSGAGAITGVGTVEATATLDPKTMATGEMQVVQVPFAASFTSAGGPTQYHVLISSPASDGKGWKVPLLDTASNDISLGPSVAEVEGASQGGQTDSYVTGGSAFDRYDIPVALMAAPTAPATFVAAPAAAA